MTALPDVKAKTNSIVTMTIGEMTVIVNDVSMIILAVTRMIVDVMSAAVPGIHP